MIEQSVAKDEMDNLEEAEVAIDTEATAEVVDSNKDNDEMSLKNHILQSELNTLISSHFYSNVHLPIRTS